MTWSNCTLCLEWDSVFCLSSCWDLVFNWCLMSDYNFAITRAVAVSLFLLVPLQRVTSLQALLLLLTQTDPLAFIQTCREHTVQTPGWRQGRRDAVTLIRGHSAQNLPRCWRKAVHALVLWVTTHSSPATTLIPTGWDTFKVRQASPIRSSEHPGNPVS